MSSISVGRTDAGYLVRIVHHGTLRESRALAEFAAGMPPGSDLALDLAAADYLDSTFLGSLMGLHKRMNLAHQGHFTIHGPVEHARHLMGKTRLDTVLRLVEAVPDTVGDLHAIPLVAMDTTDFAHFIADAHRKLAELGGPDSTAYARVADQIDEETGKHPRE